MTRQASPQACPDIPRPAVCSSAASTSGANERGWSGGNPAAMPSGMMRSRLVHDSAGRWGAVAGDAPGPPLVGRFRATSTLVAGLAPSRTPPPVGLVRHLPGTVVFSRLGFVLYLVCVAHGCDAGAAFAPSLSRISEGPTAEFSDFFGYSRASATTGLSTVSPHAADPVGLIPVTSAVRSASSCFNSTRRLRRLSAGSVARTRPGMACNASCNLLAAAPGIRPSLMAVVNADATPLRVAAISDFRSNHSSRARLPSSARIVKRGNRAAAGARSMP